MFHGGWNLAIYLSAAALLALGVLLGTNVTAAIAVAVFLLWDVAFVMSSSSLSGRSIQDTQQQVQNAREHISYFLAFYGVLFGVLFTQDSERQHQFLELCRGAGVSLTLLVIPLLLATVPLLFVPIRLPPPNGQEPSLSLKVLLVFTAFMQKSAIFLFIHVVLRMLSRLGSSVAA
jgi:hypothetical protein